MRTLATLRMPFLLLLLVASRTFAAPLFPRLENVGDDFTFLINADAHVNRERPNQKPSHNQMFRDFVREANVISPQPTFVIFNGDIYERQAVPDSTNALLQAAMDLKPLAIAVTGNHDVRDFDVDYIFRPVQRAFNGTTNDTFSFDCGQWHFVVMPTKELVNTPEKETAFLKWLEADLKANRDRPTMGFMHYHLFPVGTSQLEFYTYSIDYKNRLRDTLTRYDNVKFVFSGHVHAGVQSSVKTAWNYKGVNFIIAPSPVRPRPFGEEYPEFSLEGGYYARVEVKGQTVRLLGRQLGKTAEHQYPATFRAFDKTMDARCFTAAWELPMNSSLRNGGFENGLIGWQSPYRYVTDQDPGHGTAVAKDRKTSGQSAVRISVREKGQGWALGEFTELYQIVQPPVGQTPTLRLKYFSDAATEGGGYVWLAGFKGREAQCVTLFHWGPSMREKHALTRVISYVISGGDNEGARLQDLTRQHKTAFWKLPGASATWHTVDINLAEALNAASGSNGLFASLGVDRFTIGLGAWCSDEPGSQSTVWFDDVSLESGSETKTQVVDGHPFDPKQQGLDLLVPSNRQRR